MFCAVYSMDPKLFIPCLHHEGGKGNRLADDFLEELLLSVGFFIFIWDIFTSDKPNDLFLLQRTQTLSRDIFFPQIILCFLKFQLR